MEIKWIECGLPWYKYDFEAGPEQPDLKSRYKGEDSEALYEAFTARWPEDAINASIKRRDEIKVELADQNPELEWASRELRNLLIPELQKLNDPILNDLMVYWKADEAYWDWVDQQPEWLAHLEAVNAWKEKMDSASFCGRELNQPGTLVEIDEDGTLTQYLIGDINTNSGVCDDCRAFASDAIVVRYAVVWNAG